MITNSKLCLFLLVLIVFFVLYHISELSLFSNKIFSSYLDDILCIPIVMSITLVIFRLVIVQDNSFIFPMSYIIIAVIFFSVLFELILPTISIKYTRDVFDIVAYSIGGIVFHYFIIYSTIKQLQKKGTIS